MVILLGEAHEMKSIENQWSEVQTVNKCISGEILERKRKCCYFEDIMEEAANFHASNVQSPLAEAFPRLRRFPFSQALSLHLRLIHA